MDADKGARTGQSVDAVLTGGPDDIPPGLRETRIPTDREKIKIPHRGGYEHFERDAGVPADPTRLVFRWTGRTAIAE